MRRFLSTILILFCTAVPPEAVPPDYLVTEITITCQQLSPAPLQVTNGQTMGQILQYLRNTPLKGQADSGSMDHSLPLYTIHLTHPTGRITEYRQLGTEYLAKGGSPWYRIDPEQGSFLIAFFPNSLYNKKNI